MGTEPSDPLDRDSWDTDLPDGTDELEYLAELRTCHQCGSDLPLRGQLLCLDCEEETTSAGLHRKREQHGSTHSLLGRLRAAGQRPKDPRR